MTTCTNSLGPVALAIHHTARMIIWSIRIDGRVRSFKPDAQEAGVLEGVFLDAAVLINVIFAFLNKSGPEDTSGSFENGKPWKVALQNDVLPQNDQKT